MATPAERMEQMMVERDKLLGMLKRVIEDDEYRAAFRNPDGHADDILMAALELGIDHTRMPV